MNGYVWANCFVGFFFITCLLNVIDNSMQGICVCEWRLILEHFSNLFFQEPSERSMGSTNLKFHLNVLELLLLTKKSHPSMTTWKF